MSDFTEQFLVIPDKKVITISIDSDLLKFLDEVQKSTRLSRSTLINVILNKFKKENKDIIKEII